MPPLRARVDPAGGLASSKVLRVRIAILEHAKGNESPRKTLEEKTWLKMTNVQLYLAIGVPVVVNALMLGLLMAYINAKFEGVNTRFESVNQRFESINQRFESVNQQLQGINQRFDDMRDLWRSELRRVEEVIDARLKHLEEK